MSEPRELSDPEDLPEALLDLALGRVLGVPAGEQQAVLEGLCAAHPEHATALRQMLAAIADADHVLATSFTAAKPDDPAAIGSFRVLHRLGEGAFGVVYLCAQEAPIRRHVAVKVLRPGAGDRNTLARFDAERQALAIMNHPAIANVFDAGALPDGRPYFVMEHVGGAPITTWCNQHRLSVEDRLLLFLALCDGVQHAHLKGVIHRDLKPSNVLVVEVHGKPQPKIIDFGLAKALHQPLQHSGLVTEAGRVLGTPGYMSPEQAEGQQADVDTRSDVFSLGVILYVLLAGELPWARDATADLAPVRPSARVASDNTRTTEIAAQRSSESRRLVSRLRGDLDWIVLKALSHERERRYETVQQLAEDIRRHLRSEPVHAGPPSTAYRLRKFVRRYRIQVLAAAAILVTLLIGLAATLRFATKAQTNLERFELLALGSRLQRASASVDLLYPPWPDRLPDFDRWIAEHGVPLEAELPRLRAALAELRAQALPYTEADRAEDRRKHPVAAAVDRHRATIVYEETLMRDPVLQQEQYAGIRKTLAKDRDAKERELPDLERRQQERLTWKFARESQQFLHDTMARLYRDLSAFAEGEESTLASVRTLRAQILQAEVRDLEGRRGLWETTRADIASDPRFGGLQLEPQAGLIPLGKDPASGLHEFYHPHSAPLRLAVPARGPDGKVAFDEAAGIVFVLLPGGRALMGAQKDDPSAPCFEPEAQVAETPVREVTLAPFFLAKHELTQNQWIVMTGRGNPSLANAGTFSKQGQKITRRHPVESVSWDDCKMVLEREGFELPTEAQWEYACRAGTTTIWPTGNTVESLRGFANLADATAKAHGAENVEESLDDGHSLHAPVGSFAPNAFGLHDMVGNVAEWCRDYFGSFAYLLTPRPGDGLYPVPEVQVRPVRGGSFENPAGLATSASRTGSTHQVRSFSVGVRPARRVLP